MDPNLPGSFVHRILQVRILELVARPSSRGSSDPGIEPKSLTSPALADGFFTTSATLEAHSSDMRINCSCFGQTRIYGHPIYIQI